MSKSRIVLLALAIFSVASLPMVAKADTLTYDFTYNGTGTYVSGETATGAGSITFTFSSLGSHTATVTDFSFTDTLTAPGLGSSTFNYGLSDLKTSQIVIGGTLADPILTNLQISTNYLAGSNAKFSKTNFNLAYSGSSSASTGGVNGTVLGDFTYGNATLTAAAAPLSASPVPEPSSFLLFGTGLCGAAALLYSNRKRFIAVEGL